MTLLDSKQECPKCANSGWIPYEDEQGYIRAKECSCRQERILKQRLQFAELPEAFKDMSLKTFRYDVYRKQEGLCKIKIACQIIKAYLENFEEAYQSGMGLYLYSAAKGSGKTRMIASIANELMQEKKKRVKFAVSTTILKEIKATWQRESTYTESKLLDDLSNTDILIIDDFGTEKIAGWINDRFYHVINERYIHKKVTLFTSNYELDKLDYDDRITNRIQERVFPVAFPEESIREYISEQNHKAMIQGLKK